MHYLARLSLVSLTICYSFIGTSGTLHAQGRSYLEQARERMVRDVVKGAGVTDENVLKAMNATPRHLFVPTHLQRQAYYDMALPIGDKQTISSPFIVAYMTQSLRPKPTDRVLEIGTGSGYQAAVLSPIVKDVYSIEIVENLGNRAKRTLDRLGYNNVHVKVGDGYKGWPQHAPFDKIIVTCSPESVPKPLVDQLAEGGLMVVPVGKRYQQTLYLFRKEKGKLISEALRSTLFVPMTGTAESGRKVKPDPLNPRIENSGFEKAAIDDEFVEDWYYQRQLTLTNDGTSPEGKQHVVIANKDAGRAAHVMQGLAVDGREVHNVTVSAWVRHQNLLVGADRNDLAVIAITFYDQNRKDLGAAIIGPFLGSEDWHQKRKTFRVPPLAREAIIRIGLFGATGEIAFDDVRVTKAGA